MHKYKKSIEMAVPAVAAGSDGTVVIGTVPFDAEIVSVEVVPVAAINGANTNTRKVEVINKGAAGSGSTVTASLQFNSGVNAAAFDAKGVTVSATETDLDVTEGDVLAFVSTHVGTGIADPGGLVRVVMQRRFE
jgi:hypothetical protein